MGKGRKPKPTKLKILSGEPNKRRINLREPPGIDGAPTKPAHLDAIASQRWDETCAKLAAMGILTAEIGSALELYCATYSDWRWYRERAAETGRGNPAKINRCTAQANKCLDVLCKLEAEFGFTPSARSKIVAQPRVSDDKKARLFGATK